MARNVSSFSQVILLTQVLERGETMGKAFGQECFFIQSTHLVRVCGEAMDKAFCQGCFFIQSTHLVLERGEAMGKAFGQGCFFNQLSHFTHQGP